MDNKQLMIELHYGDTSYGLLPDSTRMFMNSKTDDGFSGLLKTTDNFTISTNEGVNTIGLLTESKKLSKIVVFEEVDGDVTKTEIFVPAYVNTKIELKLHQIEISTI